MKRCTCNGDPQRMPCPWCARRIDAAEDRETAILPPSDADQLADAYERQIGRS